MHLLDLFRRRKPVITKSKTISKTGKKKRRYGSTVHKPVQYAYQNDFVLYHIQQEIEANKKEIAKLVELQGEVKFLSEDVRVVKEDVKKLYAMVGNVTGQLKSGGMVQNTSTVQSVPAQNIQTVPVAQKVRAGAQGAIMVLRMRTGSLIKSGIIELMKKEGSLSFNRLFEACQQNKICSSKSTFAKYIKELEEKGNIKTNFDGRQKLLSLK